MVWRLGSKRKMCRNILRLTVSQPLPTNFYLTVNMMEPTTSISVPSRPRSTPVTEKKNHKAAAVLKREGNKKPLHNIIHPSTFVPSTLTLNFMTIGKGLWP